MLDMSSVVADAELEAPKPFLILRSAGQWTQNGFAASNTVTIQQVGPVQRAGDKELEEIPQADRVHAIMAFWCLIPIYITRGKAPTTAAQGVTPEGAYPGTVYTVDPAPPPGTQGSLYKNGIFQTLGIDYQYSSGVVTMLYTTSETDRLYYTWTNNTAGSAFSDIMQYDSEQYRVLAVKHYPGSGFYKALGTRLSTI
jgi:hypothetical protein